MAGDEINSFTNSNGPPSRCPWRRQQLPSHVKPIIIGCSQQFCLFGDNIPHLGDGIQNLKAQDDNFVGLGMSLAFCSPLLLEVFLAFSVAGSCQMENSFTTITPNLMLVPNYSLAKTFIMAGQLKNSLFRTIQSVKQKNHNKIKESEKINFMGFRPQQHRPRKKVFIIKKFRRKMR